MIRTEDIGRFLDEFAPRVLAESWDNVGLLVGDPGRRVERLMTCLTITPATVAEAVEADVELIVSHHPLPFHAVRRLVPDTTPGRLLWQLATRGMGVYSPHTAFDSARAGINQQLAEALELQEIKPLVVPDLAPAGTGTGRQGRFDRPRSLRSVVDRLKAFLGLERMRCVGELDGRLQSMAIGCGAAGELLGAAQEAHCDALLVGETNFHTCLEAEATGVALLLPGHYASERFAVERLAERLAAEFPELIVWPSRRESDPLVWA